MEWKEVAAKEVSKHRKLLMEIATQYVQDGDYDAAINMIRNIKELTNAWSVIRFAGCPIGVQEAKPEHNTPEDLQPLI